MLSFWKWVHQYWNKDSVSDWIIRTRNGKCSLFKKWRQETKREEPTSQKNLSSYSIRGEIFDKCNRGVSKTQISHDLLRVLSSKRWLTIFNGTESWLLLPVVCVSQEMCYSANQQPVVGRYKISSSLKEFVMGLNLPSVSETEFWFEHQFAYFWNECILWTTNGSNSQVLFSLIESTGVRLTWFDCKPYDITYATYNSVFFFRKWRLPCISFFRKHINFQAIYWKTKNKIWLWIG